MLRKPTILVALLLTGVGLAGPTEAQATMIRPVMPPSYLTEVKQLTWCHYRNRGDYQGEAACVTRAAWSGSQRKAQEAVRVGWCEAGLNRTRGVPFATYWGAWQFDKGARKTYRWGYSLVEQVRATERMNSARGWQPWPRCKPGGVDQVTRWPQAPLSVRAYG